MFESLSGYERAGTVRKMSYMLLRADKLIVFFVVLALVVPACVKAFASSSNPAMHEQVLLDTADALNNVEQKTASLSNKQDQEPSITPCLSSCNDWKASSTKPNAIKPVKSAKAILPAHIALPKLISEKITQRASPQLINQRPHRYTTMLAKSGRLLI